MKFKEYESKPIVRKAHRLTKEDLSNIVRTDSKEYVLDGVHFVAYEPMSVGSFIVFLNGSDIYHCNEEVFKERNIV